MKKFTKAFFLVAICLALVFSISIAKRGNMTWMGIVTQTVDEDLAEAFDLSIEYGAIINDIYDDSPAEEAGLEEDDIIIRFDGEKIYDYDDLIDNLEDAKPDQVVTLTVMRDGKEMDIEITLGEKPRNKNYRFYSNNWRVPSVPDIPDIPSPLLYQFDKGLYNYYSLTPGSQSYIGVELTEISDQMREYFGVQEKSGVLITRVDKDSPAAEAGLKAGDVIISIENDEVEDYRDVKDVITDRDEGDSINITVIRKEKTMDFTVTVGKQEDDHVYYYNAPDISIQIPKISKHKSFFSEDFDFDKDEFDDAMEDYHEAMKELKEELKEIQHDKKFIFKEYFDTKEFKEEMKKLKKELKTSEHEISRELKEELENLKRELKRIEKRIDD